MISDSIQSETAHRNAVVPEHSNAYRGLEHHVETPRFLSGRDETRGPVEEGSDLCRIQSGQLAGTWSTLASACSLLSSEPEDKAAPRASRPSGVFELQPGSCVPEADTPPRVRAPF